MREIKCVTFIWLSCSVILWVRLCHLSHCINSICLPSNPSLKAFLTEPSLDLGKINMTFTVKVILIHFYYLLLNQIHKICESCCKYGIQFSDSICLNYWGFLFANDCGVIFRLFFKCISVYTSSHIFFISVHFSLLKMSHYCCKCRQQRSWKKPFADVTR